MIEWKIGFETDKIETMLSGSSMFIAINLLTMAKKTTAFHQLNETKFCNETV